MKLDVAWVRSHFPDREIYWFDSLGSTMMEASRLAAAGCPSGTVAGAEEQTSGIGRQGRTWYSEAGAGLYQSIVYRPGLAESFPGITLAIGLAAREAILESTGVECDLRWPNDLMIGDEKCGGILVNAEGGAVIAGIGINVNHDIVPVEQATSLRLASGRVHARETLLVELLRRADRWAAERLGRVIEEFERVSSYARGKRVEADGAVRGTTAGLDAAGFLRVRRDNGEVVRILAGGVRPCS
jgi:BirA family biotin operon repressor/biotin-[acetyl-CoA-carboxylase] ligase